MILESRSHEFVEGVISNGRGKVFLMEGYCDALVGRGARRLCLRRIPCFS